MYPESIPDIKTDTGAPSAQMKQGLHYFNEMEKMYGPISSISGNSLCGGVANYVAVDSNSTS